MNHQLLTSKSGKVFPFVWHSILRLFIGIRVFRTKALYDMDGCTCLLVYCTSPSTPQQWPLDWCFSGCSVLRKAATFSQQDLLVDRCMGLVHLLLPFSLKSQRGITLLTWCLCRNIPGHLRCQCGLRKPGEEFQRQQSPNREIPALIWPLGTMRVQILKECSLSWRTNRCSHFCFSDSCHMGNVLACIWASSVVPPRYSERGLFGLEFNWIWETLIQIDWELIYKLVSRTDMLVTWQYLALTILWLTWQS